MKIFTLREKKLQKILMFVLLLVILSTLLFGVYKIFRKKQTYIELSYKEVIEKINSKDKFALFIGSSECSHCTIFKGTINSVIKDYNIKIYYIDLSKLNDDEYAYLHSNFSFSATPTTIVIENGKEYGQKSAYGIVGAKGYDYVVERLKKAGVIKE